MSAALDSTPQPDRYGRLCIVNAGAEPGGSHPIIVDGRWDAGGTSGSFRLTAGQGAVLMLQLMQALQDSGADPLPPARKWAADQKEIAAQAAGKGVN